MAQDTTPAIVVYHGNGNNAVPYDVPFDKGYYGEVKVAFIRRGLDDYTYEPNTYTVNGRLYAWANGATYIYTHTPNPAVGANTYNSSDVPQANNVSAIAGQTITVNSVVYTRAVQHDIANQLLLTWTGTTLTSDDFICIIRDTERGQPYSLPNNQKHIESALDNLERQIQEVANKTDNALIVDPSHVIDSGKMNPLDWMKSIIRCMDFSVRALRYANGWLDYSLDDPNIADGSKTWHHLLNTQNIKDIRQRSEIVDGVTHYWVEYLGSDNQWRTLSDGNWDSRITHAETVAQEAKDIANNATSIAGSAVNTANNAVNIANHAVKPEQFDNVTIKQAPNGMFSAYGTKNGNTAVGAADVVYDWVGTEAEYYEQDVSGQHPDWVCFITDDDKEISSLYITVDYNSPNERLVMTSGGTGVGTKITQANYSSTYTRLILS